MSLIQSVALLLNTVAIIFLALGGIRLARRVGRLEENPWSSIVKGVEVGLRGNKQPKADEPKARPGDWHHPY